MQIAIDGASKRNGTPTCLAIGVAWIETEDGDLLYKSRLESESTNQRGEMYGLIEALQYAIDNASNTESIIIITDSEYLFNTVSKGWYETWFRNGWCTAKGDTAKNSDLWNVVRNLLIRLNMHEPRVFMQWTKGHIFPYTPSHIRAAMEADFTGVELYERIGTKVMAPAQIPVVVSRFNTERREHDHMAVDETTALEWVIFNTTADAIATYLIGIADAQIPL